MLESLRLKSSSLCKRCEDYKILDVFGAKTIGDTIGSYAINGSTIMTEWKEEQQRHNLVLGAFNSILLYGSCPLCRLIFRVFPGQGEDNINSSAVYYVRPFPSYDRQSGHLKEIDEDLKSQYAIHFAVESEEIALKNSANHIGDDDGRMINRVLQSFALSSKNSSPSRRALRARRRGDKVDFKLLQRWINRCTTAHGVRCQRTWSDDLLTTRMIDVSTRRVVQCSRKCEYVALSYVWGLVVPEENALERRRLPQTIEDAITATHELGLLYLWVRDDIIYRRGHV